MEKYKRSCKRAGIDAALAALCMAGMIVLIRTNHHNFLGGTALFGCFMGAGIFTIVLIVDLLRCGLNKPQKKTAPPVPVRQPIRPTPAVPANEAGPVARPVAPPLPTTAAQEETMVRFSELVPGLERDSEIYPGYSEDKQGLDCYLFEDGHINAYVIAQDVAAGEAVQRWLRMRETLRAEKRTGIFAHWLLSPRYLTLLRVRSDQQLIDLDEETKARCRAANIRITSHAPVPAALLDHVTGKRYRVVTEEWPGSVDDAATYGQWDLVEV